MSNPAPVSPIRADSPVQRIPVILLTGFLGSGKTTLLRELLSTPAWADTAVLVNELGAVGLDHQLVWGASGATLVLENGCVCCSARDDLVSALETLFWQRLHRQIPRFARVIIETTGLANPGPIIRELFSHRLVAERYQLQSVVTTVDAVLGDAQLGQHPESLQQAASADLIFLTKTDLATAEGADTLAARLRQINPMARLTRTVAGAVSNEVWRDLLAAPVVHSRLMPRLDAAPVMRALLPPRRPAIVSHHDRVQTTVLHSRPPMSGHALERALRDTVKQFGEQILRIKGMVSLEGESSPVLVQVVQTMVFPFERMGDKAGSDSFLVFITMGLDTDALRAHFSWMALHTPGDPNI
jgi:G3E family GTPase